MIKKVRVKPTAMYKNDVKRLILDAYLHGLGTGSFDGLVTALAERVVQLVVMSPTVRRITIDIEALVREGLLASLASKAGRMPLALQLAILSTDSFLLHRQVARPALGQE
jgi:hypothetical protein